MSFSKKIIEDKRVQKYNEEYMRHPFIQGMREGSLEREKFKKYLIQDSLYLKGYAKVYASIFLSTDDIWDLQFLHSCIGVVVSEETNMHTRYLKDHGLDVYMVDGMEMLEENRAYLDYMLGFAKKGNIREIFVSAFPCTLSYEYIGKALKKECGHDLADNYYSEWIEAYAGKEFEKFTIDSCRFLDKICNDIDEKEEEKLIRIFLEACQHEMNFWNMSYK